MRDGLNMVLIRWSSAKGSRYYRFTLWGLDFAQILMNIENSRDLPIKTYWLRVVNPNEETKYVLFFARMPVGPCDLVIRVHLIRWGRSKSVITSILEFGRSPFWE